MPSSRAHATAGLSALILVTLVVPAVIPLANARHDGPPLPPTYLPALEGPRERAPFSADRIPDLAVAAAGLRRDRRFDGRHARR